MQPWIAAEAQFTKIIRKPFSRTHSSAELELWCWCCGTESCFYKSVNNSPSLHLHRFWKLSEFFAAIATVRCCGDSTPTRPIPTSRRITVVSSESSDCPWTRSPTWWKDTSTLVPWCCARWSWADFLLSSKIWGEAQVWKWRWWMSWLPRMLGPPLHYVAIHTIRALKNL